MDSETLLRLTSQPSDQYTARLSGQTQSSSEDTYGDIDDSNEFDLLREDDPYNGDLLTETPASPPQTTPQSVINDVAIGVIAQEHSSAASASASTQREATVNQEAQQEHLQEQESIPDGESSRRTPISGKDRVRPARPATTPGVQYEQTEEATQATTTTASQSDTAASDPAPETAPASQGRVSTTTRDSNTEESAATPQPPAEVTAVALAAEEVEQEVRDRLVREAVEAKVVTNTPEEHQNRKWYLLIAVALLVVVCAVVVAILLSTRGSNSNNPIETITEPPTMSPTEVPLTATATVTGISSTSNS